jgi:hypothetical protein
MHLVGYLYEDFHDARSLEYKVSSIYQFLSKNFNMPNDKEQQLTDVEHSLVISGDEDSPLLIYLRGHIPEDSLLSIKE